MAAQQGHNRRATSRLIAWLAVPRVVTLPTLLCIGVGGGQLAWSLIDSVKILAWLSGMMTPFCMICATAVWAMRDRLDEAVETEQMSAQAYQAFEALVTKHRSKSTMWAAWCAVMALLGSMPAVSNQLIGPVWHWMVLCSAGAAAGALYAYMLSNHWDFQIRAFRSHQKLEAKRRQAKDELLSKLQKESKVNLGRGWSQGPPLSKPTVQH
ncbi:hypothetical protein [Paracidovorax cattleyae]|uniref:hypothetical protein n=1 Tax=Paracidovorax cattleyae TaxID=80868 RepID=UPI00115FB394